MTLKLGSFFLTKISVAPSCFWCLDQIPMKCGVVTVSSEWDFNVNLQPAQSNPQCSILSIFVMSFADIYDTESESESNQKSESLM